MRTIDFNDWRASADVERARVRAVEAAFAEPYRRERSRDPEESELLRQRGTPEHLIGPPSDETARRAFAVPPARGVLGEIDLALLDPAGRDERRILIEAEHPEFADALDPQLWRAMAKGETSDREEYLSALSRLPRSWERTGPERAAGRVSPGKLAAKVRKAAR